MTRPTLNLGILAHVDAGKTSLTERLLFDHGVIAALGSVDGGDTRTDSGELERERGITIRSAVASFTRAGVQVNLIDTPGHPDFIAEVERALTVLDAAVLVLSAVEGVQAQTRVLFRSLRRLGVPVVLFINKIDRPGARPEEIIPEVRAKLGADVFAMNDPAADELRSLITEQTVAGSLHPAYFGSAITGAGVQDLANGLITVLGPLAAANRPAPRAAAAEGAASGLVFAVERRNGAEKVAYLRLFGGEVRERQRVRLRRGDEVVRGRVTRIEVVGADGRVLRAGSIGRVRGLSGVRVGDRLGERGGDPAPVFSPPGLEAVVRPACPGDEARLHAALLRLADEDPLIRTRVSADGGSSVLLYGAVQREVLAERLVREFGVEAVFGRIQPVCFERLCGSGTAMVEFDKRGGSDFWATVGLRVAAGRAGAGTVYRREDEWGALPRAFHVAVEESVRKTLEQGLFGWEVLDCEVTVVRTGWKSPSSTAADFRGLTPVVLLRALQEAGTRVHEPCQAFEVEVPGDTLSAVLGALAGLGAAVSGTAGRGESWAVTGEVPSRSAQDLTRALPGLTHGEGALWMRPGGDRPVSGPPPVRARLDGDPLDRERYLRHLNSRMLA
ncbi:elongation factor G [Winogradskya humida]|uniref:Elongation factor G n=1 Tax=Winogradskya humida TaxID=113566 RepID=A0ABQ3ZJ51_9ACTN|nr:TetM/TetW/TetO/TetS family tetracycline resistance ribosomal protection protein [Actinoplanes humidus]GIE18568.1 elongation factor G [Actinoplanes humidus]